MAQKKIIFIVGPTAVRKTQIAFLLAKKIGGEIISCDSMQVYREISIANNKPSEKVLKAVFHHLIGVVSVAEDFDVMRFHDAALAAIKKIHQKDKIPIVVGGSGLYMDVLLNGIFKGAGRDDKIREKLEAQANLKGTEELYRQLKDVDPQAAKKIHPRDLKRLIRALEVFALTKKPISKLQKNRQGLLNKFNVKIFALNMDRQRLYRLIDRRVEKMFQDGLVKEIKNLPSEKLSRTARGIIGLKEIKGFLEGKYDLERAKYLMKLNPRHYAKRQLTWFRSDGRLQWIVIDENDAPGKIAAEITREIENNG